MGSLWRTMERKRARKMAKEEEGGEEEAPESGDGEAELTADDVATILDDAEVLVRTGAEKIDFLIQHGHTDLVRLRDKLDGVWEELQAKVAAMEEN